MKFFLEAICPPIIWNLLLKLSRALKKSRHRSQDLDSTKQDLDMYWDPEFAKVLEEWGADNVWNEIQMIMAAAKGKVLDIACGTGKTIQLLDKFDNIEIHGFDISELLISKAVERGIPKSRLKVSDATKTDYPDANFLYSYSIGSLEHFTPEGINQFIAESARYTSICSYHMIPVSRSGANEGWLKTVQSFFNNSEEWWLEKFSRHYSKVIPIPSKWEDEISYGRWFVCYK